MNDFEILSRLVWAEARGEDDIGQILVVNVVMNRVNSPRFPNTIRDVVFQPGQFTPITNGAFDRAAPDERIRRNVQRALNGEDHSRGALFFRMIRGVEGSWHEQTLTALFDHGTHRFFTEGGQGNASSPARTIMLDPGHGGRDPGAVNGTRHESRDNLRLGLALRDRLRALGQRVIMTREADVFVGINERSAHSNRENPDIFVSLHRNAFRDPSANGYETILGPSPTQTERNFAQRVHREIVAVADMRDRGVKSGFNFGVLRDTRAPAMMIELGFITNARDNELFDRHFNAYVEAIARGILACFGQTAVPTPPTPPTPPIPTPPTTPEQPAPPSGRLFRVQAGAFRDRSNADALRERLQAAGHGGAFLMVEGGMHRVIVASFRERVNANALLQRLHAQGFGAFIAEG